MFHQSFQHSEMIRKRALFIVLLVLCRLGVIELKNFIEDAKSALRKGDVSGAINIYNVATRTDPVGNCVGFYLLGNIYFTRGNLKEALLQYESFIKQPCTHAKNSDAPFKRIDALIKLGHLASAKDLISEMRSYTSDITALDTYTKKVNELSGGIHEVESLVKKGKFNDAVNLISNLKTVLTHSLHLLKIKVECYEKMHDNKGLLDSLKILVQYAPNDLEALYKLANIHYNICDIDNALEYSRKCLSSDQDNKPCKSIFKLSSSGKRLIKKIKNELKNPSIANELLERLKNVDKNEPGKKCFNVRSDVFLCHINSRSKRNLEQNIKLCSKTSSEISGLSDDDLFDLYLSQGISHMELDELELAKKLVDKALGIFSDDNEAKETLETIDRLLKKKSKKNYYKILGVKKNAGAKEIKLAYRKLAMVNHPDKFQNKAEKTKAELFMLDLNNARDVLLDEEKRRLFDSGIDPLDNEEMQGRNQNQQQYSNFGDGQSFFNFGGGHFSFHF